MSDEDKARARAEALPVIADANISAMQPSLRRGLASTVPFMRILRQLRRL
jgi:hypothetical protein